MIKVGIVLFIILLNSKRCIVFLASVDAKERNYSIENNFVLLLGAGGKKISTSLYLPSGCYK